MVCTKITIKEMLSRSKSPCAKVDRTFGAGEVDELIECLGPMDQATNQLV